MRLCNSKNAAFSLIEVTLALGVAAFCSIAVFGLMPVGVQTNRTATSQTAATNIIAAVAADLRATPTANSSSSQFGITFGTDATLYFDSVGQFSTSLDPNSRYQLNIAWNNSPPTGLQCAAFKVTWPAAATAADATGGVEMFAAFERN